MQNMVMVGMVNIAETVMVIAKVMTTLHVSTARLLMMIMVMRTSLATVLSMFMLAMLLLMAAMVRLFATVCIGDYAPC